MAFKIQKTYPGLDFPALTESAPGGGEIQQLIQDSITTAMDPQQGIQIGVEPSKCDIWFVTEPSTAEKIAIDAICAVNTGVIPNSPNENTVNGPTTAIDEAIARFDGVTGKLLQNSVNGPFIKDAGSIDLKSGQNVQWNGDANTCLTNAGMANTIFIYTNGSAAFSADSDSVNCRKTTYVRNVQFGSNTFRAKPAYFGTYIDIEEASAPNTPAAGCVRIFPFDNGGQQEWRIIFANGTVKTLADDIP